MRRLLFVLSFIFLFCLPQFGQATGTQSNSKQSKAKPFRFIKALKYRSNKKPAQLDIRNLFLFFPDSVFNVNATQPKLSLETRQQILEAEDLYAAKKMQLNYVLERLDIENGFLKFRSIGASRGQEIEMRFWKAKGKHQIVGVNIRHWKGSSSYSEIRFFDYFDCEFKEVTEEVYPQIALRTHTKNLLPEIPAEKLTDFRPPLEFPRYSEDIRVLVNELSNPTTNRSSAVVKLAWKGDRFRIR